MAYNLRTGLIGSGDIDVNVSLSGLTADNIQSGIFGLPRIPTLSDSKISDLNAAKLTGFLNVDRIETGSISDTKLALGYGSIAKDRLNVTGAWAETEIPTLPKGKVDPNHDTQWAVEDIPDLSATKITSGVFASADRIPDLSAAKITSGTFAKSRVSTVGEWNLDDIPFLPASKISSGTFAKSQISPIGAFAKSQISTAEAWPLADIPNLPATKIASGQFDAARIPDLSALKIQSDTLSAARIPGLDASKITTGTISSERLPASPSLGIIDYNAINGDYLVKSVGNTYTTIHSSLRSNNVVTVPSSQMVEVKLSFYYDGLNYGNLLGRLVDGGTNYEYVDQVINNANLSTSTENTLVAQGSSSPSGYTTITWTLKFAAAQVGDDIDIKPQLKDDYPQETIGVRSGLNSTSGVCFPSTIFKITALPTTSTISMYLSGGF